MPQWVFAKLDPAAVRRDPNESQLFKDDQAGENEYAGTDALVREILQNAMDAGTKDGPVRVRLALHADSEGPDSARKASYFRRLESPLSSRQVGFNSKGHPELSGGFMVVEDFGTRGLGGNPLLSNAPDPDSKVKEDFFWFWRNIGLSGKTGDDLGRWGLGKTVYRAASRVGCMFGLTVRKSDQRCLLMGQAVLHIHSVKDQQFMPEGFWCDGPDEHGVPRPIETQSELDLFRSEWNLTRTTEPGLSVVVPYVATELTGMRILQAICIHFFLPVMRGELIVDVCASDIKNGAATLNAQTLETWCETVEWDPKQKKAKRHMPPPVKFVRSCLKGADISRQTRLLGERNVPVMNDDAFDPTDLQQLRKAIDCQELVEVRVRVGLHRKNEPSEEGQMSVFLQKQESDQRFDTYYVREGMTITKLNSRAGLKGVKALVIVDKGPLAQLLGDSENPAHEDWHTSADRPKKFWKTGWIGRVTFCRKIVDALLEVLAPPNKEADFDLLSDFFSIEKTAAPQKSRSPDEKGETPARLAALTPKPKWYRLDGRRGGFRIVSTNSEPVPENAELTVSVAYDVPSGNPLKKWSSFDFDFKRKPCPIQFSAQNVEPRSHTGNVLKLKCTGPKFQFAADGFDIHADLYVRIYEAENQTESPDEHDAEGDGE